MNIARLSLLFWLAAGAASAQQYPSPTFQNLTVLGTQTGGGVQGCNTNCTFGGNTTITGGTISGTNSSGENFTATGGTVPHTAADWLGWDLSVKAFANSTCNGVADDTSSLTALQAAGGGAIPFGSTCLTTNTWTSGTVVGPFTGPGKAKAAGSFLGPNFTGVASQPTTGNWSGIDTAYSGDASKIGSAIDHRVTGAATLSQPATGYVVIPEASARTVAMFNNSGWNQSPSGNGGRTGLAVDYLKMYHYGQGDMTGYNCYGILASTKPGATSFLASPAMECLGGNLFAGANGQYIEFLGDMDIADNGFDIAAVGAVFNFNRSNAAGGLGTSWAGRIVQSVGTKPLDVVDSISGPVIVGYDLSLANMAVFRLASVTVNSGGTGYTVGDLLTVSGGTAVVTTVLKVATLGASNAIATLSVVNNGMYSTAPNNNYTTLTLTGGTGTGASVSGQYQDNTAMLLPQTGGCIQTATGTGAPAQRLIGVQGGVCLYQSGLTIGGVNTSLSATVGSLNIALGDAHTVLGKNNTFMGLSTYDVAQVRGRYFSSGAMPGLGGGSSQTSDRIFHGQGTGAIRVTADGLGAGGQNVYQALAKSAHNLTFRCTAIDETNSDAAVWRPKNGMLTRINGGNATYVGDLSTAAAADFSTGAASTATVQVSADTTNQSLNVTVTPPTGTGHTWDAQCVLVADQLE